jgi:hypothetical protein
MSMNTCGYVKANSFVVREKPNMPLVEYGERNDDGKDKGMGK